MKPPSLRTRLVLLTTAAVAAVWGESHALVYANVAFRRLNAIDDGAADSIIGRPIISSGV